MRRLITYVIRALLVVLVLAAVAFAVARGGLKEVDQATRDEWGGSYLQTDHGILSYTREGPVDCTCSNTRSWV